MTVTSSSRPDVDVVMRTGTADKKSASDARASSLTWEMTCSCAVSSPPSTPMAAATAMPRPPLVLGTTTLLTFLMMLPLASMSMRSGSAPSAARARAAQ